MLETLAIFILIINYLVARKNIKNATHFFKATCRIPIILPIWVGTITVDVK